MESVKRPVKNETDSDLLRQQTSFLKEKEKPSVQHISSTKSKTERKILNLSETEHNDASSETNIEVVEQDIMFDVKEHNTSFTEPFVFETPSNYKVDISQFIKKTKISKFSAERKSQSIFMQLVNDEHKDFDTDNNDEIQCGSILIDGSGLESKMEAKKVHEENLAKLSAMSQEEILQHQLQLKNYLKPEIVEFIQKRKALRNEEFCKRESHSEVMQKLSPSTFAKHDERSGQVLRKEGKDSDALILEKALQSEKCEKLNKKFEPVNKVNEKTDIPEETKKLLAKKEKGCWLNMSKIEKEKLEWMTNLPQPKPVDLKTGFTARFDFEGKLLSREADIPTYKGLHHHGEEPEIAGYSLEELFLLARSSLQSQRVTALNTIAHILENNWYGMMDSCFDSPLLPLMLNAGIVPLLRWALDDISMTSVAATISAIHSLLISKADEACLQNTFCWLNGHLVPQLEPHDLEEPNIVLEELTDADLIKLDVIKGFLRIDILPRFMYIMKVMCPPPLVCKLIIEICTHLAQHSFESAKMVAEYPGLLDLIFDKFLPLKWQFVDYNTLTDTTNYQCPMPAAVKLIRIIASSSKDMAIYMHHKFDVTSIIIYYLAVQPCDEKLHAQDTQSLVIETLKLWHTYLCYGIGVNVFIDLFPVFLKQLTFCLSLDLNADVHKHIKDFEYVSHLFKALEAIIVAIEENIERNSQSSSISAVFQKVMICLKKWLWQLSQEMVSSHGRTLLGSCINFVVTYCRKTHESLICEDWKPCSSAKEVFEEYVIPTLKSAVFHKLLSNVRSFSLYLSSEESGNKRDGKTLVSLGSVLYKDDIIPILKEGTPLPLLSAILNYIALYKSFFNNENEILCLKLIFQDSVIEYLKSVSAKEINNHCWFLKFEKYFIYQLIQLLSFLPSGSSLCHESAIGILQAFTSLEECIIEELFENIIFNQNAIMNLTPLFQSFSFNENSLLYSIASRLPIIAQCFVSCFLDKADLKKSRSILNLDSKLDTLFCLNSSNSLVQKDWSFAPISKLYQSSKQRKIAELSPEEILQVTSCLQWIYLCHDLDFPLLQDIPASAEFYYLCQVFLLDENLFRDEKIKLLLWSCISIILKKKTFNLCKINYNNIKSFNDIYLEMLIQYEAVSYGDEIFGSFLLLPLQQSFPSHWKKLLFTEHSPILTFLKVPLKKLLAPIENYLEPVENDVDLLKEYFKALGSGSLNYKRCPLLYLMAVHHIHHFIFSKPNIHLKFQKELLCNILKLRKDLQKQILLYANVSEMEECGFTVLKELPDEDKNFMISILGCPVNI